MPIPPWLQDRLWRWRVIVLLIALLVVGALIWRGYDPLAAAGGTLVIFLVISKAIDLIIKEPNNSSDTNEIVTTATNRFIHSQLITPTSLAPQEQPQIGQSDGSAQNEWAPSGEATPEATQ